jgi:hypothetical protein
MEAPKKEILLSEEDIEIIVPALEAAEKRCLQNSKACLNGYGKATSYDKSQEWINKAERIRELTTQIAYMFI